MLVASLALAMLGQTADIAELTDLDRLTRPAEYTAVQFSSWDRASAKGDWYANDDRGQYLRVEEGRYVMVDADGPGAIVRIWSANPSGDLRIELDGQVVLDEDMAKLLTGKITDFPAPYAQDTSRGCSLYLPMAFQKHAKITSSASDLYYQVHVRRYPDATELTTWSRATHGNLPAYEMPAEPGRFMAESSETAPAVPECLVQTNGRELNREPATDPCQFYRTDTQHFVLGRGVVRRLEIELPADETKLRTTMLTICVDEELCVQCPLGDFFGTAPGRNVYASAPMSVTSEGVGLCLFPMPFSAFITIDVDATVRIVVEEGAVRPFRFHAFWRGDNQLKTHPRSDWPVANLSGKAGRFVGCSLTVRNPVKAWWGEGDEHVYVDGEKFPSFFGTGTEDYFGYAWCDPTPFDHPFHAQTRCDGPGNKGYTSVVRWHIVDDIPFTNALRFDMEVWHWVESVIGYSTVAYFYAEPGVTHDFKAPDPKDLAVLPVPGAFKVAGAIEGESLKVVAATGGVAERQDLDFAEGFSNESHLWWKGAKPGAQLRLAFDSKSAGPMPLTLGLTHAPDYGIVSIALNGTELAHDVDGFGASVAPAPPLVFKNAAVKQGANELVVTITGTNVKARPQNYMFGLDWLKLGE